MRRAIVIVCVAGWSLTARAQPAVELQAQGEVAARNGDFAGAIDKFKAADRIEARASHARLIALAYTRRNLWPQAEIFRTQCHDRANANDPLPDWMAEADRQIDEAIAVANVAAVTVVVEPADAAVRLSVSRFAPDEQFPPRVIHLAPGTHQIFASAPGFDDGHQLVEVRDKTPQRIVIALHRHAGPGAPSKVPWVIVGSGLAIGVLGVVLEATWYNSRVDTVQADVPGTEDADLASWRSARNVVIGCYIGSAVTIGVGLVLRASVWKTGPAVAITPTEGGGVLSIGWAR